MKKQILVAFTMLSLVVTLAISSAVGTVHAQLDQSIRVNIPFDSTVGKQLLPAGEYSVAFSGAASQVMIIRSRDGHTSFITAAGIPVAARGGGGSEKSKLVFNRYGNQYFLSQVWRAGAGIGQELKKSPAEREIAQSMKMAKNEAKPETVALLARQ